jgi:hypothetical protein
MAQTALDEVYDVYRALLALQILAPAGDDQPAGCFGALAGLLAHRLSAAYVHLMDEHHRCTCGALTPAALQADDDA